MKLKKVVIIFLFLLTMSFILVKAEVTCNPNFISVSYDKGNQKVSSIQCTNSLNSSQVQISKIGDFTIDSEIIGASPSVPTIKTINIDFNPNANKGLNSGYIEFSDGSNSIPISFYVEETSEPEVGCRLIELPHTTTYRIKQGEVGSSSQIKVKVSTECPSLSMSVTEETQMSKPMYLQGSSGDVDPGGEFSFTIGLDGEGVSTGTYQNNYIVTGYSGDEIYQKQIFLSTIIAVGTSPIDEDSFSTLPTCNVESDMSLNNSYTLTCNNENPNIQIEVPYNEFFKGISVSESEGKFEYVFQPIKIGNTYLTVLFKYKGVSIGNPFKKEIKILQGSVPLSGTQLEILFYQTGNKKKINDLVSGNVSILVRDNKTQNVVPTFTSYLNGEQVTNNFMISSGNNYELIIDSPGYMTSTLNFTPKESFLQIKLTPDKDFYLINDVINITSNEEAKFLFDNEIISSPYTLTKSGTFLLEAVKEGFKKSNKTIEVRTDTSVRSCSPNSNNWKVGKKIICELSKNSTWEVYSDSTLLESGVGGLVKFKIEEKGLIEIKSEGLAIYNVNVKKSKGDWIKFWNWKYYSGWVLIFFVCGGTYFLLRKNKSKEESKLTFVGQSQE